MMELCVFLLTFFVCFAIASPNAAQVISNGEKTKMKAVPAVDALISRLEQEQWSADDEPCLRTTLDMLWGVKNNTLWATWVWDSMQPPVGSFYGVKFHMGNYDQCLQAPWSVSAEPGGHPALRTQYCVVNVKSEVVEESMELEPFDSADEYFRTPSKNTRTFNEQSFGVCLPASCSPSSVAKISSHMHQLTHLPDGEVLVDHRSCRKAGEVIQYPNQFYGFWLLVGILGAIAFFSTFYNDEDGKQRYFDIITKSFCIRRNYNALFKVNSDEIKVMNGMRFLTATVIVVVHEAFFSTMCPVVNGLERDQMLSSKLGLSMSHSEIVVDTFFAMSGLLLIRGLMLGKQKNVLYTLVKRYIRLIGPLAICILYLSTVAQYMDEGPFWNIVYRIEWDVCQDHWWKTILMINTDVKTICHVVTWYVSCDFQLAILGTFLFYLFKRNRGAGVAAYAAVFAGVIFNLAWVVYQYKLDIMPFSLKGLNLMRNHTALNYTYLTSQSRAGSYLVGMLMGYIITTYKPCDYRNVISKKWSVIITFGSVLTMAAMMCIGAIFYGRPYDPLQAAVVVATNRVLWALAVCCIIGACEYGSVPVVSDMLSWQGFVPLSKLSYGLYLLHPLIIQKGKFSGRSALLYTYYNMHIYGFGVLVAGLALSFGMYMILEAPLINVSNTLFSVRSKPIQQNGIKKETNNNDIFLSQNGHTKAKIS